MCFWLCSKYYPIHQNLQFLIYSSNLLPGKGLVDGLKSRWLPWDHSVSSDLSPILLYQCHHPRHCNAYYVILGANQHFVQCFAVPDRHSIAFTMSLLWNSYIYICPLQNRRPCLKYGFSDNHISQRLESSHRACFPTHSCPPVFVMKLRFWRCPNRSVLSFIC